MRRFVNVAVFSVTVGTLALFALGRGSGATPKLEGTSWQLAGWSVSSQDPNDFTITAEFTADTIASTSAVNQYSGSYTLGDDGSISVGTLISTKMAGPEAAMQAESTYLRLLGAARSCKVDGDTLTLSDEGGNTSLIYTAQ